MTLFDDLKARFPVKNVANYGRCVIIKNERFEDQWEKELQSQGITVFSPLLANEPFWLVKLPSEESSEESGERLVYSPESPPTKPKIPHEPETSRRGLHLGPHWTEEEDKLLIQLASQKPHLMAAEIAEKMPGRTEGSVSSRIWRLQKLGLIKDRQSFKRGPKRPPSTPLPPTIPNPQNENKEKLVKELLGASTQLYPKYPHASALLLREAAKQMEA